MEFTGKFKNVNSELKGHFRVILVLSQRYKELDDIYWSLDIFIYESQILEHVQFFHKISRAHERNRLCVGSWFVLLCGCLTIQRDTNHLICGAQFIIQWRDNDAEVHASAITTVWFQQGINEKFGD